MIPAAVLALSAFAQAFAGSWLCHSQGIVVPWEITPAPAAAWTTVRWGDQSGTGGGIAYVGYVPKAGHWIYRDFHYDGSYADITGTQTGNRWRWTGPFYSGAREFHGDIVWTLTNSDRIDRTFRSLVNGKITPSGSDFCVRAAVTPHPQ